ncbi:hypothetical protein CF327_g3776 [Tilletia walkeri]|uniref:Uncharacterized protein n=1 Tax=Tilletia walkeri TaxID=117179 RepID=A0A8X7T6H5_9BASI|nr:hypothetical protein CF327_g3776 [Tilletia walkeri]KAE8270284.1 hypothetical protein A4X09_0g2040 [Tilletia walkeri]
MSMSKRPRVPRAPTATDQILGCFSRVSPSPTLDHLIRYLGTWSGTDKVLMLTQYSSKLLIAFLSLQHRVRLRILEGTKSYHAPHGGSPVAARIERLVALVSDARILFRIWGILPIVKWMIALERTPPPTRLLHNLERIQGWSMLIYCPLEAVAYLGMHSILPISTSKQNACWLWGSRMWALYVVLQLLHLVEDNRLLRLRARALERSRGHPPPLPRSINASTTSEKSATASVALTEEQTETKGLWNELHDRKEAILNELWVNLGYLPLTVHWSHPTGLIGEPLVGLFGTIAAVAGLRSGWRGTAAPIDVAPVG